MHRLAGPLVRKQGLKVTGRSCQRRNITVFLPYLQHTNESQTTIRREASTKKAESTVYSARHDLSPTYFDSKQKDLVRPSEEPKSIVHRLRQTLDTRNVAALHVVYAELREEDIQLKDHSYASSHTRAQSLSKLTIEDIRAAMELLLGAESPDLLQIRPKSSGKMRENSRPIRSAAESVQDGTLVQQIFQDMSDIFGFTQDRRDCKRSVLAFAMQTSSSQRVFEYFKQLRSTFEVYQISNYVHESMVIFNLCKKEAGGINVAQQFWSVLEKGGGKIHKSTRDVFFHLMFKAGNAMQVMEIAQNGLERTRMLPLDQQQTSSLSTFLEDIARAGQGHWKLAIKMVDEVLDRAARDKTLVSLTSWHNLLIYTGIVRGPKAAIGMAKRAQKSGLLQANEETFHLLLLTHQSRLKSIAQNGSEEDVVRLFDRIQEICSVAPPAASYTVAIHAILGLEVPSLSYETEYQQNSYRSDAKTPINVEGQHEDFDEIPSSSSQRSVPRYTPGQIHEASLLFQRLQARGLQPSGTLVNALILAYTSTYIPQIDKVLGVYQYWRSFGGRLKTSIYNILLFTCAKAKESKAAQEILQDMVKLEISLNYRALADMTVLLMEASYSYRSAHEIYTRVRDAAEHLGGSTLSNEMPSKASVFDQLGWLKIIDRFSKLQFEQGSLPPIDYLLEMLVDMRASGYSPEPKQYTSLLKLYGRTATVALSKVNNFDYNDKEGRSRVFQQIEEMRGAVRSIHNFLQREESIEPDLILITCLMDAYNRVGRSQYTLEIWHRLVLNKTLVDSACISVVLDTCGHAGLIDEARRAWKWLQNRDHTQKLQCNKGVWDAWIECLARCGYLLEAIDMAFMDMPVALKEIGEEPDVKTMEMLLRFASMEKHRWNRDSNKEYYLLDHLRRRLQAEMPDVWDQIKVIHIPV